MVNNTILYLTFLMRWGGGDGGGISGGGGIAGVVAGIGIGGGEKESSRQI